MNILKCLSRDYQSPTAVVMEITSGGVLCQSGVDFNVDSSTMENVGREEFIW